MIRWYNLDEIVFRFDGSERIYGSNSNSPPLQHTVIPRTITYDEQQKQSLKHENDKTIQIKKKKFINSCSTSIQKCMQCIGTR
jgi:hypothetical protein